MGDRRIDEALRALANSRVGWCPFKTGATAIITIDGRGYGVDWMNCQSGARMVRHWPCNPPNRDDLTQAEASGYLDSSLIEVPQTVIATLKEQIQLASDPDRLLRLMDEGMFVVGNYGCASDMGWSLTRRDGEYLKWSAATGSEQKIPRAEVIRILRSGQFSTLEVC